MAKKAIQHRRAQCIYAKVVEGVINHKGEPFTCFCANVKLIRVLTRPACGAFKSKKINKYHGSQQGNIIR